MNDDLQTGKFGYSFDGEHYQVAFDSFEDAKLEAFDDDESGERNTVFVAELRRPEVLEYVEGGILIDRITLQDDYCIDCAEGAFQCTREQSDELDSMLRATFAGWLDKHDLWPKFYIAENVVNVQLDGAEK